MQLFIYLFFLKCNQVWTGLFWSSKTLFEVSDSFTLTLGHSGLDCPAPQGGPHNITVVSSTGIQHVRIIYCGCSAAGSSAFPYLQLFRAKLFPASYKSPRTVFTFECLRLFHILTLQGKLTGFDYYTSLERLTNNSVVDPPAVSTTQVLCY